MNQRLKKYRNTLLFIFSVFVFPAVAQDWTPSLPPKINEPFSLDMDGNYAIVGSTMNETDQNGQNEIHEAGAAFIYQRNAAGDWVLMQKIVPMDRDDQDRFGLDVAISAEGYALVGTQFKNAAYFFEWDGTNWVEVQKFEGQPLQRFGFSVAMHDDKALIGAPGDNDFVGAAYLYQRDANAGQWVEVREMKPPAEEEQGFGHALDISETYIIVGAPFLDRSESEPSVGAAYIFSGADGTFMQPLDFPLLQPGDRFGTSVAISESAAIIGIPEHALDDNGADDQNALNDGLLHPGIIGIFSGASWSLQKIVSPDRSPNDQFGAWVDIQGDLAIVGADQEGLDADGGDFKPFAGLAYILERGGGGWSVVDKIDASDRDSFDNFGSKVAIGSFGASVIGDDKTYFYRRCIEAEISSITASNMSVCQGETVLLTAVGDLTDGQGVWYVNSCGGDILGLGNTIEVTPDATTTYFVSAGSCSAEISCVEITITVNPLPQIEASTTSVCQGETVLLTASGDLGDGQGVWYMGGCGGEELGSGNTLEVTPDVTTTYFVSAGSCSAEISCVEITITVNPLPQIEASTTSVCQGETVLLTAVGDLADGQWLWTDLCGGEELGSGNTLEVTPNVTTTYFLNPGGCGAEISCAEITITVNPLPQIEASATSVCQGESALLTAVGDLADGQWLWTDRCGGDTLGLGNILEVIPDVTTTYFVSGDGCSTQISCAEITIAVNPIPQIEASTTREINGNDGMIDLSVSGGTPPYTYDWDTNENSDFDDAKDVEGLSAGTYQVTVRDSVGCIANLTITLAKEMVTGLSIDPNTLVSVYPNPHPYGMVYIKLAEGSIAELTVRDLRGEVFGRYTLLDSEALDLNALQKGTYLLEFLFENERLMKRWVKL